MDTQDPAQPGLLHGERVQPDGPLSGEVKRGGSGPSRRYLKHLAALHANPKARLRGKVATPTVYFVRALTMGLVKIGVTMDLADRMKTLRVGCPDKLELVGAIRHADAHHFERTLHFRFAGQRSHGEWFHSSPELEAVIADWPLVKMEAEVDADLRSAMELAYGAGT